jgi:hypothetical protein
VSNEFILSVYTDKPFSTVGGYEIKFGYYVGRAGGLADEYLSIHPGLARRYRSLEQMQHVGSDMAEIEAVLEVRGISVVEFKLTRYS